MGGENTSQKYSNGTIDYVINNALGISGYPQIGYPMTFANPQELPGQFYGFSMLAWFNY